MPRKEKVNILKLTEKVEDGLCYLEFVEEKEVPVRPSFSRELSSIVSGFLFRLHGLEDYYEYVLKRISEDTSLDGRLLKGNSEKSENSESTLVPAVKAKLTASQKKTMLRNFEPYYPDLDIANNPQQFHVKSIADVATDSLIMHLANIPEDHKQYLNQQTLVHAVTLFESFVKSYIQCIFRFKPEHLGDEKQLSFKELKGLTSIGQVREVMILKEILKAGTSVKDIKQLLMNSFNFKSSFLNTEFKELEQLKEQRNGLIHDPIPEILEEEFTGTKSKEVIPSKLDSNHVRNAIGLVSRFIDKVHKKITSHFGLSVKNKKRKKTKP